MKVAIYVEGITEAAFVYQLIKEYYQSDWTAFRLECLNLDPQEAAKAIDMGNFYAVPADNRDLNYDKYFKEGDTKRATIEEFNSDNTRRLNLEETKDKIASLEYIQNELNGIPNLV